MSDTAALNTIEALQQRVAELEHQNNLLLAQSARDACEITELKATVKAHEEIHIRRLEIRAGQMDAELQSEVFPAIADAMVRIFELAKGPNYCGWGITDPATGERYELFIQRVAGKTPIQKLAEATVRLAELETERHRLHVLVAWAQGEISEGMATALLGVERVEARGLLHDATAAGIEAARQWREAHPPVLPHIPTPEETDEHVE